jgi:glycosyltransferase involved in cell wall biosynthesis
VIVRAKNSQATIERALSLLREQTVACELIVVDSGSTDGTLAIARRLADRVIEIAPEAFAFGRALNIGAEQASAHVHAAISSHSFVERRDWLERALALYEREDVAATNGIAVLPDGGQPARGTFYQDRDTVVREPLKWGFTNHASTWRARVWQEFHFDERLEASEDREWAKRVLDAGWVIAYDPALVVPMSHRWRAGPLSYYRRIKKETRSFASFEPPPPYGLRDCLREWWSDYPADRHSPFAHRFLNYYRFAELAGRYAGARAGARQLAGRDSTTSVKPNPAQGEPPKT